MASLPRTCGELPVRQTRRGRTCLDHSTPVARTEVCRRMEDDRVCVARAIAAMTANLPSVATSDTAMMRTFQGQHRLRVHISHNAIYVGGYIGCVSCGSVVGIKGLDRLARLCPGHINIHSRRPISLLAKGQLPHRCKGNHWPDGSISPSIYVLTDSNKIPVVSSISEHDPDQASVSPFSVVVSQPMRGASGTGENPDASEPNVRSMPSVHEAVQRPGLSVCDVPVSVLGGIHSSSSSIASRGSNCLRSRFRFCTR